MRTVITLPDQMHARAKQHAADLGISLAELTRRLLERELAVAAPAGNLESIRGMVSGEPFDMAVEGRRIIGEAVASLLPRVDD